MREVHLKACRATPGLGLRGGFSLLDMMVVVAVIALLMAIMMPALSTAREHGRDVKCKSNLHKLCPVLLTQGGISVPSPWAWTGYVAASDAGELLRCPSDNPETQQEKQRTGPPQLTGDFVEVWPTQSDIGPNKWEHPKEIRTWTEVSGFALPRPVRVDISPLGVKEIAAGTVVTCLRFHYDPPGGGSASGSITLPSTIIGVIYTTDGLYETDDLFAPPNVVYGGPKAGARGFEGHEQNVARFESDNTLVVSFNASSPGDEGRILTAPGGMAGASSYGMNREVVPVNPRFSQLILAEYRSIIINSAPGPLQPAFKNLVAPRHFGRINTARVDGSVRAYYLSEIDPALEANFVRHWKGNVPEQLPTEGSDDTAMR